MSINGTDRLSNKVRSVLWDLRILLVEDEEYARDLMHRILSQLCEHVDTAGNGEQAYALYQQHYYDLIVTDLEMPEKNGFWLIEQIRNDSYQKPILVSTAFSDETHMQLCLSLGVTGFFVKPLVKNSFLKALYHVGSSLHEKKVMFEYQQELERYTKASLLRKEQLRVLQSSLEQVLTVEQKQRIVDEYRKHNVVPPKFLHEESDDTPALVFSKSPELKTAPTTSDTFAYDAFKTEDLQKFYEAEEDVRDFLSKMFIRPELAHEVFHHIAPQIVAIAESLGKYPHYSKLSDKLMKLASSLENVSSDQELKRFNYLFESFMDTLSHWCHVVLGDNANANEQTIDIYSVMHDIDIICNAIDGPSSDAVGELELF